MKKDLSYHHYRSPHCVLTLCIELDMEREIFRVGHSLCQLDVEPYERKVQNARAERQLHEPETYGVKFFEIIKYKYFNPTPARKLELGELTLQFLLTEIKTNQIDVFLSDSFKELLFILGRLQEKIYKLS